MNFGNVIEWNIPEGSVEEVRDSSGNIIWQGRISVLYHDFIPYTLTYNPNFTTTQAISTDTFYSDEPYPIQPCYYEREGYVFESWNEKSDGTGQKYLINDEFIKHNDYQIYAQWYSGILMIYRDESGQTKVHKFNINELPNPFRITDYLSPYPLVEPFNTILGGDNSRLLGFIDSNGEIKTITERCVYQCPNIEYIYLPGITINESYCFANNKSLKNLTITNMQDIINETFYNTNLTYCKVDSSNRKSYPNTDKGVDIYNGQIIVTKPQTGSYINVLAVVRNCNTIDRDDIKSFGPYIFAYSNLKSIRVQNLTSIVEGGQVFPSTINEIYINNNILSSCNDDPENQNNYVVGENGSKLIKVLPSVTHIRNNNITSFQSWWCERHSNLKSIEINNDYVKSVANNTALLSKDGKTLIRVLPTTEFTPERYPTEYNNLTAIYADCFLNCSSIPEINLPNVIKVIGSHGQTIRNSTIRRFLLDNLESSNTQNFYFGDSTQNCEYISFNKFDKIINDMFKRSQTVIYERELTVNMPNAVSIGIEAFYQNCGIRHCTYDKVTSIGVRAFSRCMNLTTISLKSCTEFGDDSFKDCVYIDGGVRKTHLTDVYCNSVPISYISINASRIGFPSGCTCHCSDGDYRVS